MRPLSSKKSRLGLALSAAALLVSLSATSVLAGEITGTGEPTPIKEGTANSICAFSGLNDNPNSTNPFDPPGRVQSYGFSFVSQGLKAVVPNPGFACNPNSEFE